MRDASRKIIGRNIKNLRLSIGFSQLDFSIITGLSKATIVNIESAKTGYNLNLLDKILDFSLYSLSDISSIEFYPDQDIRLRLKERYKNENLEYYNLLIKSPEIVYAIKYKLLPSNFIDHPKEINEIRAFFGKLGWNFKGTSISNALKRMSELICIIPHPNKRNTNLYSAKIKKEPTQ